MPVVAADVEHRALSVLDTPEQVARMTRAEARAEAKGLIALTYAEVEGPKDPPRRPRTRVSPRDVQDPEQRRAHHHGRRTSGVPCR